MKPKISIIVPIYNVENYLEKCIDSILNQTFKDFELILVDDGSPDRCGEICDEYANKDKRIVVIHKENGGLSSARNAGLDIAKGEYIGFIDSDDWIEKEMYETLYNMIVYNQCDLAVIGINIYKNNEKINKIFYKNKIYRENELIEEIITNGNKNISWSSCDKLWKLKIISNQRFKEERVYEDFLFFYEASLKLKKIIVKNIYLYNYRTENESIMRSKVSNKILCHLENIVDIYNLLPHKYSQEMLIKNLMYYTEFILLEILKEKTTLKNLSLINQLKYFYKKNDLIISKENNLKGFFRIKFKVLREFPLLYIFVKFLTKRY